MSWLKKNRFSLDHLRDLCVVLGPYLDPSAEVTDQNRPAVIEAVRDMGEVLVWGDQNQPGFFEFFLEKNMTQALVNLLRQKNKPLKIQIMQTLSILIENLQEQNSLYYLLSNNLINNLIVKDFDYADEDLLAYCISFLKSLSLKLDARSVHFFFDDETGQFPLFTKALNFFDHRESMVRIAVRVITSSVFAINDPSVRAFVMKTAPTHFENCIKYIRRCCHALENVSSKGSPADRGRAKAMSDEIADNFCHLQDVLNLNNEQLSQIVIRKTLEVLIEDHLCKSLCAASAPEASRQSARPPLTGPRQDKVSPKVALFVLTIFFDTFKSRVLVNSVGDLLFHPDPEEDLRRLFPAPEGGDISSDRSSSPQVDAPKFANRCLEVLLSFVGKSDALSYMTELLICSFARNPSVSKELLEETGLGGSPPAKLEVPAPKETPNAAPGAPRSRMKHSWCVCFSDAPQDHMEDPVAIQETAEEHARYAAMGREFLVALVNRLVRVLLNSSKYRLPTVQLTLFLLKELADNGDVLSMLSAEHVGDLDRKYLKSTIKVNSHINGSLKDIFLELFEGVLERYKRPSFDTFLRDGELVVVTSAANSDEVKPSGEADKTERAIQKFLVLRALKLVLKRQKDDALPLRSIPMPKVSPNEFFLMDSKTVSISFQGFQAGQKKAMHKCFVVYEGALLVLDPPEGPIIFQKGRQDKPRSALISAVLPLQSIMSEVLPQPANALNVVCIPKCWKMQMVFPTERHCREANVVLGQARDIARQYKLSQIYAMTGYVVEQRPAVASPPAVANSTAAERLRVPSAPLPADGTAPGQAPKSPEKPARRPEPTAYVPSYAFPGKGPMPRMSMDIVRKRPDNRGGFR
eukprot:m51a1_g10949 hypothetical protein (862) ;mRNA; f:195691-198818